MSNQTRATTVSSWEVLFPFSMGMMILGCSIQYMTGGFLYVAIASAITSACCAFLAFIQIKNLAIDLIRIQVYLSAVAYFFPLSYYPFIDHVGLLLSNENQLVAACYMIVISISIGWCVSFMLKLQIIIPRENSAFMRPIDIALLVVPICLYMFGMMVTGKWSYASTHEDFLNYTAEPISPLIIISSITVGIGPMVAYNYGLLKPAERSWIQAFIAFGVLALGTAFWLIEGRRSMSTFVILSAVAFFAGRTKGRISPKTIVTMAILSIVIGFGIAQGSKFFYAMRIAREIVGGEQAKNMSITDFIEYSGRIQTQVVPPDVKKAQEARPFVIDTPAMVLPYVTHHLFGKELIMQVITTVPAFLFPGKAQFTAEVGNMEDLWTKEYGVPLNDYANSFSNDGYLDFWYFGFLIYCIFSALCVQLAYRLYSINPSLAYFCAFSNIALFLQVETAIASYVGYVRNMLFLFIPLWFFYATVEVGTKIPGFSKRTFARKRLPAPGRLSSSPMRPDISKNR
jgi:hypothetical protein